MARITVVGSGVVGQASGRGFLHHGHEVTFVDINPGSSNAFASKA